MPSPWIFFCFVVWTALFSVTVVDADDSRGKWGSVFNMEVIPIHAMVLPDSHVLSYGADATGKQGGGRYYEVWDTTSGQHQLAENHMLLTQEADVNIFCSSLSMDITTGNVLVMGGDEENNQGINKVLEFDRITHEIRQHPSGDMVHPRWYGTSVNLPDDRIFIAGGKGAIDKEGSSIPEVWSPGVGFRELRGADIPAMWSLTRRAWWYPHVYVNSKGDIILVIGDRRLKDVYLVSADGNGSIEVVGTRPFAAHKLGPSIMYDVDKVAMLTEGGVLWSMDISNSNNPVFVEKVDLGPPRTNGAMSMLPDGRVLIAGGTSSGEDNGNNIELAVYIVQIWDPVTNTVFTGPKQDIPRLYHSSGLILPDGSVFSAGGGAPGPLQNSNGQIYYPGYMFDATGEPASRPVIVACPQNIVTSSTFRIVVEDADVIDKVTATKPGSMTHSRNCDARWMNLAFTIVNKTTIQIVTPGATIMIPGLWYLNVLDAEAVPSIASVVGVNTIPLGGPTDSPTTGPTASPSRAPSSSPSTTPSTVPSLVPSSVPTSVLTSAPVLQNVASASDPTTNDGNTSGVAEQSIGTAAITITGILSLLLLIWT